MSLPSRPIGKRNPCVLGGTIISAERHDVGSRPTRCISLEQDPPAVGRPAEILSRGGSVAAEGSLEASPDGGRIAYTVHDSQPLGHMGGADSRGPAPLLAAQRLRPHLDWRERSPVRRSRPEYNPAQSQPDSYSIGPASPRDPTSAPVRYL